MEVKKLYSLCSKFAQLMPGAKDPIADWWSIYWQRSPTQFAQINSFFLEAYTMIEKCGVSPQPLQTAWHIRKDPDALAQAISQIVLQLHALEHSQEITDLRKMVWDITSITKQIRNGPQTSGSIFHGTTLGPRKR